MLDKEDVLETGESSKDSDSRNSIRGGVSNASNNDDDDDEHFLNSVTHSKTKT